MNLYTDGSCRKTKIGAYGFCLEKNNKIELTFAKRETNTTNNRMELKAFLSALQYVKKIKISNLTIYSDSEYVVKGFNQWSKNWQANGWLTFNHGKVSNRDLWKKIIKLNRELTHLNCVPTVLWVKAHGKNKYNNFINNVVQNITKL